jgi:hypothetical protein
MQTTMKWHHASLNLRHTCENARMVLLRVSNKKNLPQIPHFRSKRCLTTMHHTSSGNFSGTPLQNDMAALFIPAAAGCCAMMLGAYTYDLKQKLSVPADQNLDAPVNERLAFMGPYGHISQYIACDTRGRFKSVRQTTDAQGADIFLVDYGTGALVTQYIDPRILL